MDPLIKKAKAYATQAHAAIDQRRKYTNDPYIVHPAAVAKLVASVTDDVAMICAAWLHDVVEDTPCSIEDIAREFGDDVASLVADLTDVAQPGDGNREVRKAIDRAHTAAASPRAKTIKLADLIDNTKTITRYDQGFARVYMAEKKQLLKVLSEGDGTLYEQACSIVDEYYNSALCR